MKIEGKEGTLEECSSRRKSLKERKQSNTEWSVDFFRISVVCQKKENRTISSSMHKENIAFWYPSWKTLIDTQYPINNNKEYRSK